MKYHILLSILFFGYQPEGSYKAYFIQTTNNSQNTKAINHLSKEIAKLNQTIHCLTDSIIQIQRMESGVKNIKPDSTQTELSSFSFRELLINSIAEIAGAFVGFGGALWLFYLGNKREKRKEEEKNGREQKDRINYFGSLVDAVLKLIENQKTALEAYSDTIKKNPLYIPQPKIYPTENLERLQRTLNNEIYYHSFLNTFGNNLSNTNKFRNITACCDYFINQFGQIREMHITKLNMDHERKMKYKKIFTNTLSVATELGKSSEFTNPQLFTKIDEILGIYLNNRDPEKFETYHQYLTEPLKTALLKDFFDLQPARKITDSLMKATHIFTDIQMQNNTQANDVDQIVARINDSINVLKENSTELLNAIKE